MKRKLIPLVACIVLFFGCKVTFVPDYDATIEQQIVDAAKANDKIYIELLAADANKRDYKIYEPEYLAVEADIHSIELKNETRKNNTEMLDIINRLDTAFNEFQTEHKTEPPKDKEIKIDQLYMKGFWKALLLAEQGLPHTLPSKQ